MWYLTSENDTRTIFVLLGKDITISRSGDAQNCYFAVPGDTSVSRKHALLSVAEDNLNLVDLGSKYGTYVNNSTGKLDSGKKQILNVNDIVKFGKIKCEWKVHKINFITCTSTLKGENVQNLRIKVEKLGGMLKTEWNESCTYLTMPAITLTIKVVLALAQGSYIVTTDYWTKCIEAVSQSTKLPDPKNFVPQVVESTLNKENVSFLPNEQRKTIFAGKKFLFFAKRQLEMYRTVVEKSSAIPLLLSESKITKSMLCAKDVIVIQYNILSTGQDTESQKAQINDIVTYLKSKNKRVVADAEIGLAILYCCTEKYCNPEFNFPLEVMKQTSTQSSNKSNILAQESQNAVPIAVKEENVKINETLTPKQNNSQTSTSNYDGSSKRKLDEKECSQSINKKITLESSDSNINNTLKRVAEDSDAINSNPAKKMAIETSADEDSFDFDFFKKTENDSNVKKPAKRKLDQDEEGEFFNFVKKKPAPNHNSSHNNDLNVQKNDLVEDEDNCSESIINNVNDTQTINEKIDITTLRGAKLTELMEQNAKMKFDNTPMKCVVKEEPGNEDVGTTVILIRNDLIVKREPLAVKQENETNGVKNFKKFKKVWPLKIQASMSKLSLSAV